uniref:Ubiquitin-like protease family profile domain-containing protein n=1 Tax=Chenopodium quinoa TaxID=63459 RepID=A0A803LBF6_CHEQI
MVKKKITKKAVDAEEGGSIGGYRYKKPTKGKGKPKEPAKPKPVPKKTQIAPEKSKAISKKAGKIPESDKPESEKAKIVPKKAKIVPKKANTNFSPEQKQAVEEIGFGGLLHLKLKTLNRQMLHWLVENFNAGSCMFTIATGKEFVVTRNDICDVFCLPLSDICVPEINKNSEDESVDKRIIQAWRSDYGLSGKQPLHLSKLESRMVDLVDGGEEFKRCFVLQAMPSFLAPTTNRTVSLKLLKAVEKVDEIKTFDWCSYVLKKLKKAVQKYKDDENAQNVSGCLLALQIMYFHRLNFQGEKESSTLPLIQHWTDVKIKKRIKLEIKAGGYGQGPLDTITYPVSQLNFRGTVFKPAPTLGYDKGPSTSGTTGRIVAFELPEGIMTDEEIKKISTDVVHETFLLFKRNMDVLLFFQSTGFQTLNDLITSRRSVSLSSDDFVSVSQTELLLSDPHYLKILDGLIDECNKMKSVHDMFRGFYEPTEGNKDFVPEKEPAQGFNENIPKDDDNGHGKIVNEGLNGSGPSAIIPGPTQNIPVGHIDQNEPPRLRANKSLCSLDCGHVGVQVPFVTLFVKSNARIFKNLPQLHLEILDYCLLKDVSMDRKIRWCVIDCFCLYLNEKACFQATGPRKFFFGVRQSFSFLHVCDNIGKGNISSVVKDLHDIWEGWVSYENPECNIMDADLIYFPVLIENHYILYVIDHTKELCVQISAFLGKRNHPKSSQLPSYGFEVVELEWRKEKVDNLDCGVFVMYHMLHFVGTMCCQNYTSSMRRRKILLMSMELKKD